MNDETTDNVDRKDHWERIKRIFQAALEEPPQERKQYVQAACASDQTIEREVEKLLAYDQLAGSFLEEPAVGEAAQAIVREGTLSEKGRLIGPYRLLHEIGHGGMGSVYLAERADSQYQKQVAIKLIRTGLGYQSAIDRFRHERQILADLDHPNIAKLLDGGTTEDGMPYFAMEFIEGIPIDEYCERKRLSITQRLELFRTICSAVHYAHQNLVIHRDLKPGNILVMADGVPKLLDFGIAKIVEPVSSADTTTLQFLTPEYASPEQVSGKPITTASDVYSLGVLLYRLLTGHSPYRVDSHFPQELAKAICEEEPEPPSAAVTRQIERRTEQHIHDAFPMLERLRHTRGSRPEKLRRKLAGDLDNIVMMALRKEPERRYSSVEQFSEDIRRHLHGLPVIARKDTVVYRTTKFIQRHKAGVGAMVLMLIILLTGIFATQRQARIAERRFNDVRKLSNSLLFELHGAIENLPGATPARELLVKRALEYLDRLATEAGNDLQLLRELAAAYEKVGDVQGNPYSANLGNMNGALAGYRKALATRQALLARDQTNAKIRRDLASNYDKIGDVLRETGNLEEALKSYSQALEIHQQLSFEDQTNRELRRELAKAHEKVGDIQGNSYFTNVGDTAGALESQQRANAIFELLLGQDAGNRQTRRDMAIGLSKMGNLRWAVGDNTGTLESYRRSLAIFQELAAEDPVDVKIRRMLAGSYNLIGDTQFGGGDFSSALESYYQGLQISESLAAADPANTQARRDLAVYYRKVGAALQKKGAPTQALEQLRKALRICEALVAASPVNVQYRRDLILCHLLLGETQDRSGDLAAALKSHRQALHLAEALIKENPKNKHAREAIPESYKNIGDVLLKMGALPEALESYQNQQRVAEELAAADPKSAESRFEMALSRLKVGEAHAALGARLSLPPARRIEHWRQAQSWFQKSLDILLPMQSRGTIRAVWAGEPERIKKELAKCDAALARFQKSAPKSIKR